MRRSVGLDLGSSAVRAAEVASDGKRQRVVRFAQVGLPPGAIVEGEVRDQAVVSAALKRLWAEGGIRPRNVVLGVSSQRAMVRLIEMPAMEEKQLRSALRYEIGDLLPIPVEQAVFDFSIIGPGRPKGDGGQTTQVLVVAAQKDIVADEISVVSHAGLRVTAVDASPLALLRSIPPKGGGGPGSLDAVVSLGAQLLVVAVRDGGVPRFLRTTTLASDVTAEQPARLAVSARKPASGSPEPVGGQQREDSVMEEVRSSIEYFLSHAQGSQLGEVQLTGGGALAPGVVSRLSGTLGIRVVPAVVAVEADASALGFTDEQLKEAQQRWATAVGLALWGAPGTHSTSLLPQEVAERRKQRRTIALAAAGLVVVAGGLASASHSRVDKTASVKLQVAADQQQVAVLDQKISKLGSFTQVQGEVASRRQAAVEALSDDVNWVSLYHRIIAAVPAGVQVSAVSFQSTQLGSSASTAPSAAGTASSTVGTASISAATTGGYPAVAQFIDSESRVKGVTALWISSTSVEKNAGTFTASAEVTTQSLSQRANTLPGAPK